MGGWRALPGCRRTLEQAYILSCCSTFNAAPVWAVYGTAYPIYSRQRRVKTVSKAIISIRKLLAAVVLVASRHRRHLHRIPSKNRETQKWALVLSCCGFPPTPLPTIRLRSGKRGVCCVTCACSDYSGFGSRGCAVHPSVQFVLIL